MRYLVNSSEMKQYDNHTSQVFGVSSLLLMEQAALAACEEIMQCADKKNTILIVCGTGNNGGDGLAIGRMLLLKNYQVDLVLVGNRLKATEQNKKQQEILKAYHIPIYETIPVEKEYDMVLDAIFGVGLTRMIEGSYREVIGQLNKLSGYKIAIDIPSGVSADNGVILGTAFMADKTITFAFDKVGLHLWPGNTAAGDVVLKEIGITEKSFLDKRPETAAVEEDDLKQLLVRPSHSNKGTFGRLLIIAGSVNMAGAAVLAGKSAYACGCGLVRIVTPEENRLIIQTSLPEAVLTTYPQTLSNEAVIKQAINWADAVVIGPGLGMGKAAEQLLQMVVETITVPLIMDADALNLAAQDTGIFQKLHTKTIITPHLGEMSRLTKEPVGALQADLLRAAKAFADTYRITCVLKDERTITSIPGGMTYVNLSGNAGMATAGSGDVLAGMIGSLIAQGCYGDLAVPLAVYLHGAAGDWMKKETGMAGLMASDLILGMRSILGCMSIENNI